MIAAILIKEGSRRRGTGQGNNKVEEDDNRGACNYPLVAANARSKKAAQRKSKKGTVNALQFPG
jgi:hypothetical protein